MSILKLSALWQMDGLTELVLDELSDTSASRDDWINLLDLSIENEYPKVGELAIEKITSTFWSTFSGQSIELVALARKYGVKKWLRQGLRQLLERDQFFSDADEEVLGSKIVLKLCRLREQRLKDIIRDQSDRSSSRSRSSIYETSTSNLDASLEEIGDEFLRMDDEPVGSTVDFPLGSCL
jgi:hypothetical protein